MRKGVSRKYSTININPIETVAFNSSTANSPPKNCLLLAQNDTNQKHTTHTHAQTFHLPLSIEVKPEGIFPTFPERLTSATRHDGSLSNEGKRPFLTRYREQTRMEFSTSQNTVRELAVARSTEREEEQTATAAEGCVCVCCFDAFPLFWSGHSTRTVFRERKRERVRVSRMQFKTEFLTKQARQTRRSTRARHTFHYLRQAMASVSYSHSNGISL